MPKERKVYDVECEECGKVFEAARPTRKTCSDNCRKAKSLRRRAALELLGLGDDPAPAPAKSPKAPTPTSAKIAEDPTPEEPAGSCYRAAARAIEGLELPEWERANVLAIADRMDRLQFDTASAAATLSKRYEELMRRIVPAKPKAGGPEDRLAAILAGGAA